jgi:hypothetical protein
MSGRIDAERILDAFLAPEGDRLADRVMDAALDEIARTPQRRALRVPWRFPIMPALTRTTGVAAVALVAVVAAGGVIYLNSPGGSGGGGPTPSPTEGAAAPSPQPTVAPSAPATPQPTWDPDAPDAWATYTSEVYDLEIPYPSDWRLDAPATRKYRAGEPATEATPWANVFTNPEAVDGDSIGMWVWQMPAPADADLGTWEGLEAAYVELCASAAALSCEVAEPPTRMCLGAQCTPALILLLGTDEVSPDAIFGDPETGVITSFGIGRPDDFSAAARYGGTVALLKAVVAQVDVREPEPGETPH